MVRALRELPRHQQAERQGVPIAALNRDRPDTGANPAATQVRGTHIKQRAHTHTHTPLPILLCP